MNIKKIVNISCFGKLPNGISNLTKTLFHTITLGLLQSHPDLALKSKFNVQPITKQEKEGLHYVKIMLNSIKETLSTSRMERYRKKEKDNRNKDKKSIEKFIMENIIKDYKLSDFASHGTKKKLSISPSHMGLRYSKQKHSQTHIS